MGIAPAHAKRGVPCGDASMKPVRAVLAAVVLPLGLSGAALAADGDEPARMARWDQVAALIFGDRPVGSAEGLLEIEAPKRAMDAALVPVTLRMTNPEGLRELHLVIDENPVPYAAGIRFGPAGDPRELALRVRIDGYTNVHAVAEMEDGRLLATRAFVKGSGGCSAPVGASREEAMADMGLMRLRADPETDLATLMIRHPNFNGMQMDLATRGYTPARFLDDIAVTQGGETVFEMTADISLSTDPVIGFVYDPEGGPIEVTAVDTDGATWRQAFEVPAAIN